MACSSRQPVCRMRRWSLLCRYCREVKCALLGSSHMISRKHPLYSLFTTWGITLRLPVSSHVRIRFVTSDKVVPIKRSVLSWISIEQPNEQNARGHRYSTGETTLKSTKLSLATTPKTRKAIDSILSPFGKARSLLDLPFRLNIGLESGHQFLSGRKTTPSVCPVIELCRL